MQKTVKQTTDVVQVTCDICDKAVKNRHWRHCDICQRDVCDECAHCLAAGVYVGQVRRICKECASLYRGGARAIQKDADGIRARMDKRVAELRAKAQSEIDAIYDDIRELHGRSPSS